MTLIRILCDTISSLSVSWGSISQWVQHKDSEYQWGNLLYSLLLIQNCRSYMRFDCTLAPIPIVEESIIFIVTILVVNQNHSHVSSSTSP